MFLDLFEKQENLEAEKLRNILIQDLKFSHR